MNKKLEKKEEKTKFTGLKEDCPCPKKTCNNHSYCDLCREKHKKSKPYCERNI